MRCVPAVTITLLLAACGKPDPAATDRAHSAASSAQPPQRYIDDEKFLKDSNDLNRRLDKAANGKR
jgi:hypothetical protein